MANEAFLVGVFYGIVPAMGFLYILLHEYQAYFDEKRVFRTFFIGLIVGLGTVLLEAALRPLAAEGTHAQAWADAALRAALFGLLEALVAAMVLNWRTFRGRRDTPFYAAAFGLGFAAVQTLFLVGGAVRGFGPTVTWGDVYLLSLFGLYFVGSILVHAAAFVWIGVGTGRGRLPTMVMRAAATLAAYLFLLELALRLDPPVANLVPLAAVVAAVYLMARVLRGVLDQVVPEEVLREAGIHRRRLARQRLREAPDSEHAEPSGAGLEDEASGDQGRQ